MPVTGGGGAARVPILRLCDHPFLAGVAFAGGEGRSNVLPWYRLVGAEDRIAKMWLLGPGVLLNHVSGDGGATGLPGYERCGHCEVPT